MYTPEGRVKASVKKLLDQHKVYYFMPATGGYGRSGVPDFVGCARGKFFAIETKAGRGQLTALQLREINRITESGGLAFVIYQDNIKDLETLFQ